MLQQLQLASYSMVSRNIHTFDTHLCQIREPELS